MADIIQPVINGAQVEITRYDTFRSAQVNQLVKMIREHPYPVTELRKKIKQDTTGLRNEARKYYNFVQKEVKKLIEIQEKAASYITVFSKDNKNIGSEFISLGQQQKNFDIFLLQLTKRTDDFSNAIRKHLGLPPIQVIYTTLADGDIKSFSHQSILGIYEVDEMADILTLEGKTKQNWKRRISASEKTMRDLVQKNKAKRIKTVEQIKELSGLNKTFDEIIDRYNKHIYKDNVHIILWSWGEGLKPGARRWKKFQSKTLNKGNFIQAYIRCLYQRQLYESAFHGIINQSDKGSIIYELSADSFIYALNENDNISGIFINDIKDFAVKASKAEAMAVGPALEIAYQILTLKVDDIDAIENILFKYFDKLNVKGKIENRITQIKNATLDQAIKEAAKN